MTPPHFVGAARRKLRVLPVGARSSASSAMRLAVPPTKTVESRARAADEHIEESLPIRPLGRAGAGHCKLIGGGESHGPQIALSEGSGFTVLRGSSRQKRRTGALI
jgi:hypothetical protein